MSIKIVYKPFKFVNGCCPDCLLSGITVRSRISNNFYSFIQSISVNIRIRLVKFNSFFIQVLTLLNVQRSKLTAIPSIFSKQIRNVCFFIFYLLSSLSSSEPGGYPTADACRLQAFRLIKMNNTLFCFKIRIAV